MGSFIGEMLVMLLIFICGFAAMLFSILAYRLKKDVFFYLGLGCTAIILVYAVINYAYFYLLLFDNLLLFFIYLTFLVLPIYFLILAKTEKPPESFDGSTSTGKVTQAYLDEVINAPDEEINYEEDLDLR